MDVNKYNSLLFRIKNLDKLIVRTLRFSVKNLANKHNVEVMPSASQMEIIDYILDHIDKNEEIYQKDLEQVLNLSRATISGILETMEKNGLINRVIDDKDSRTKKIILSTNAKNVYEEGKEKIKKVEKSILLGIPKDDIDTFFEVINKIEDNLNKNLNNTNII